MTKTVIQCQKTTLTNDQIIDIVDPFLLDEFKAKDPAPEFRAYIIAEEGTILPTSIGQKSESVTWTDRAVRQLSAVVTRERPKLFAGHTKALTEDQARAGIYRDGFARVAGSAVIRDSDKAQAVVAAYWEPEHRDKDFDSVSIEVEYELKAQKIGDRIINVVDKVLNVFGIALLDRDVKPAFANAKKIGIAFAQDGKLSDVSFQDLVAEIKRRNFHLWQITTPEAVLGREIKDDSGNIRYEGGDREFSDWILKRENKIKSELTEAKNSEVKKLQEKINEFGMIANKAKASEILNKELSTLPKALSDIIRTKAETLQVGENIDESVNNFIAPFKSAWEAVNGAPLSLGDSKASSDTIFGVKIDD